MKKKLHAWAFSWQDWWRKMRGRTYVVAYFTVSKAILPVYIDDEGRPYILYHNKAHMPCILYAGGRSANYSLLTKWEHHSGEELTWRFEDVIVEGTPYCGRGYC